MKLVPSCFGKLPVHADFLRLQAGYELNELDAWLQAGLLALKSEFGEGWTEAFEAAPRVRFVRHYPAKKSLLVGVLSPSKGKAGRHYPFVVATTISEKRVYQRPSLLPLICSEYLSAAEALIDAGGRGETAREVLAEVARLPCEVDLDGAEARLQTALAQTPQEILLTASAGGWDDQRFLIYAALRDRLVGREQVIRLPSASANGVVALWLEVIRASQGKRGVFPTLLTWGKGPASGGDIRFIFREPRGEDLGGLLLRRDLSRVHDLASEGELRAAQMRAGSLAEDGKAPVGKLVSSLGSG